jgi:hypothetical protein
MVVAIAPGENVDAPPGAPRHASRNGDTIIRTAQGSQHVSLLNLEPHRYS